MRGRADAAVRELQRVLPVHRPWHPRPLHPALIGRVGPGQQFLDIIYHAELGLDEHIDTIYRENDMDPLTTREIPEGLGTCGQREGGTPVGGPETAERPEASCSSSRRN